MKVKIPKGKYIKNIEINAADLDVKFSPRKKVALLLIGINERYWDYLLQVIKDCKENFLPQHNVDYFVWSDMPKDRLTTGTLIETEPVEWPGPTLWRYNLFLQKEAELSKYDYIYYLDADMRVVSKISDEIFGDGLTVAPHPGYAIRPQLIPPLEPNPASAAYIPRLGQYIDAPDAQGVTKKRFMPFYAAGGFQGGKATHFIRAMKKMRAAIEKDHNSNYIAIWNDESHWNKYLWGYQEKGGKVTFLDVSYVYPDSLIKEYYEPIWGRSYEPKIITLTKPFSLSPQGAAELNKLLGRGESQISQCPTCKDHFDTPGHRVIKVAPCPGTGKAHQLDMVKI